MKIQAVQQVSRGLPGTHLTRVELALSRAGLHARWHQAARSAAQDSRDHSYNIHMAFSSLELQVLDPVLSLVILV